jgi:Zn-dependent protease
MSELQQHLFLILIRLPAILTALTVHEFAHGYIAWKKGDNTAKNAGRLSFNPFDHLDLLGTIMLLFGPFGWAKPVPVNSQNLDNPKRDMVYVAAAGPASNIILAFIFGFILRFLIQDLNIPGQAPVWYVMLGLCVIINIGLAFFNLIPIPPLDGSNILLGLLPQDRIPSYLNVVRHAPKILFALIVGQWIFRIPVFSSIINPVWLPFFKLWQFLIFGGESWQIITFGGKVI